jgi:hypothetical protein
MIHIFGDSHAELNFKNLNFPYELHLYTGVTMHRIGRDGLENIGFNNHAYNDNDIIIFQFGEVDHRSHIGQQILKNRELNEIIESLVSNYINTIKNNTSKYNFSKVIVSCSPPPTCMFFYKNNDNNNQDFPFTGTNEERVIYATILNSKLKEKCNENRFIYFDYYNYYTDENGLLKQELSDKSVHIKNNSKILELITNVLMA